MASLEPAAEDPLQAENSHASTGAGAERHTKTKPPEGKDASKRMHDYLLNQKRRKEDYFLRKYGQIIQPAKPAPAPTAAANPEANPLTLPRLDCFPEGHHASAPMFHAKGPIASFTSNPSSVLDRQQQKYSAGVPYHPSTQLPPLPSREASAGHMPTITEPSFSNHAQYHQPHLSQQQQRLAQQGVVDGSLWSAQEGSYSNHAQQQYTPPSVSNSRGRLSSGKSKGSVGGSQLRKGRDPKMELLVIKAIKSREEVVERLRACSFRVDSSLGGGIPNVLNLADPLLKLFFRLVNQLRHRTLDAIEAIGAWHRRTDSSEPFLYGSAGNYLTYVGSDLGFLDTLPFVKHRLHSLRAVDDPFLTEVTADGIPIDAASTVDLRMGNVKFTAEALRIRMARKILSIHGGQRLMQLRPEHTHASMHEKTDGVEEVDGEFPGADIEPTNILEGLMPLQEESSTWSAKESPVRKSVHKSPKAANEASPKGPLLILTEQQQPQQQPSEEALFASPSYALKPSYSMEDVSVDIERLQKEKQERQLQAEASVAKIAELQKEQEQVQEQGQLRDQEDSLGRQTIVEEEQQQAVHVEEAASSQELPGYEAHQLRLEQEREMQQAACQEQAASLAQAQEALQEEWRLRELKDLSDRRALQEEEDREQERQAVAAAADSAVDLTAVDAAAEVQPSVQGARDAFDENEEAILDAMVDAMVQSLEEPYASQVGELQEGFTYEGWEIDRQLDAMINGLQLGSVPATPAEREHMRFQLVSQRQGKRGQVHSSTSNPFHPQGITPPALATASSVPVLPKSESLPLPPQTEVYPSMDLSLDLDEVTAAPAEQPSLDLDESPPPAVVQPPVNSAEEQPASEEALPPAEPSLDLAEEQPVEEALPPAEQSAPEAASEAAAPEQPALTEQRPVTPQIHLGLTVGEGGVLAELSPISKAEQVPVPQPSADEQQQQPDSTQAHRPVTPQIEFGLQVDDDGSVHANLEPHSSKQVPAQPSTDESQQQPQPDSTQAHRPVTPQIEFGLQVEEDGSVQAHLSPLSKQAAPIEASADEQQPAEQVGQPQDQQQATSEGGDAPVLPPAASQLSLRPVTPQIHLGLTVGEEGGILAELSPIRRAIEEVPVPEPENTEEQPQQPHRPVTPQIEFGLQVVEEDGSVQAHLLPLNAAAQPQDEVVAEGAEGEAADGVEEGEEEGQEEDQESGEAEESEEEGQEEDQEAGEAEGEEGEEES